MGFTLDIVVMGLVAIVPQSDSALTVLVPDLTAPYFASDGSRVPIHRPLLVYECLNTATGQCDPDIDQDPNALAALINTWDELKKPSAWGVRDLQGVEIQITPTKRPAGAMIDLGYVAQLSPSATQVDALFFAPMNKMPLPYQNFLAGRFPLTGVGAKVDTRIGEAISFNPATFAFAPIGATPDSGTAAPLAEKVRIRTYVDADEAVITATPLRDKTKGFTFKLKKKNPLSPGEIVTITIMDLAICPYWDGYISADVKHCKEDVATITHKGSDHFEPYYEFSKARPLVTNRPVPQLIAAGGVTLYDRPICPMAVLKP